MNKYIERLPRQYRDSVRDFYKDCDGWWICLDSNGPYEFSSYNSQYTIHEDTLSEAMEYGLKAARHAPQFSKR